MTKTLTLKVVAARRTTADAVLALQIGKSHPATASLPVPWRQPLDSILEQSRSLDNESAEWIVPIADGRKRRVAAVLALAGTKGLTRLTLRSAIEKCVRKLAEMGARRLLVLLPRHSLTRGRQGALKILTALGTADYYYPEFKPRAVKGLDTLFVVPPEGEEKHYKNERAAALATCRGSRLARDLGNTPPNVATPAWMAEQARSLAKELGLKVEVLAERGLERHGMGGILAVGGGSHHAPRLVRLRYGETGPKVALVGKGVTFDTGGISIKPAASMEEMKYDKCGACAVLGAVVGAAELGLPLRLEAYLPLAENMPGGGAYRPSDIVRCFGGKTVEIHNTDAEGRMLLADALGWAASGKPDYLVDCATLTGAAVVALGDGAAALFSNDDRLARHLLEAAERSGERLWRMPLWPEFRDQMKGNHADLKNSGNRWGGACTAAAFLSSFVDGARAWAHIDLAGPAYSSEAADGGQAGASGYGVATMVDWMRSLS